MCSGVSGRCAPADVGPQSWWIRYTSIPPRAQMAADGAFRPLPRTPAKVSRPNRHRPFDPGRGNWSSCPRSYGNGGAVWHRRRHAKMMKVSHGPGE